MNEHFEEMVRRAKQDVDDMNIKREIDELNYKLTLASEKYYRGEESGISDTDFDLLLKKLRQMQDEANYVPENSITQRIGSDLQEGFGKTEHPEPMLTIENSYNDDELQKWIQKMLRDWQPVTAEISTKFDGVSLELHYYDGLLVSASTRGDKLVGDDVTVNAKTIMSIPLQLKNVPANVTNVYVRGEVLMPRSVLKRINETSKKKFANCRNATTGSLKQLDPSITAKRGLIFRPWDVLFYNDAERVFTVDDKADWFDANGFQMEDFARMKTVGFGIGLAMEVSAFKKHLDASHPDWDYDGVVIKVGDDILRRDIGSSDHRAIEWGIARKWNEDREAITVLESVTWQVGSTGILTPVGNLRPIGLDGVTVSNVSLHNMDIIRKHNLAIHAPVHITRSGGVIPHVIGRPSDSAYYEIYDELLEEPVEIVAPTVCPECGEPTEIDENTGDARCINELCPGIIRGRLENWCSKPIMNIDGVGPEIINDLMRANLVEWPIDLYRMTTELTIDEFIERMGPGYGVAKARNIFESINKSVSKPLENIVAGMGIEGIGPQNAKALVEHAGSLENLMNMTEDELKVIDGIGDVLASNISEFMLREGFEWLEALEELGLNTVAEQKAEAAGAELNELKIVFSGSSQWFSSDKVEAFLESHGAKCGHSVSSKTNYLVTGTKPGQSKVDKATKLGVAIISEEDFFAKFGLSPV
jgi:DNA ligase (NAD+)